MNKNVSFIYFDEWSTLFSMSSVPFRSFDYTFFYYFFFLVLFVLLAFRCVWCDLMLRLVNADHTQRDLQIFVWCLQLKFGNHFCFLPLPRIFTVLLACCMQETDATRRVNRGRRTLTRRYFSKSICSVAFFRAMSNLFVFFSGGLAIPGWAVVTVVAVAELLLGAAIYFIMYKFILDKDPDQATTYTPAATHDPTQSVPTQPVTTSHATTIA